MKGRHYDVIVLGRGVGALVAAALLARRDFSVLVLGQGGLPASYQLGERTLLRRSFLLLGASSPALRRVLIELAQTQTFRRRSVALDPMLGVMMPRCRFELPPDRALFEREINREFPEVRRVIDDFYGQVASVNEAIDVAFTQDVLWPPGSFWERRQAARAVSSLPLLDAKTDLLGDFPAFHPFRAVVQQSVAFAADMVSGPRPLPPLAVARLHGSWTRGVVAFSGGEDELTQFLSDRVAAHGGTVALHERAERLLTGRKEVQGVLLDGETSKTGCRFVLHERSGEELADLAAGQGLLPSAQRQWPRVAPAVGRFVVSVLLRDEGVPEALGPETLLLGQPPGVAPDPWRPPIRLSRAYQRGGETLLLAEVLLPLRGGLPLTDAREAVLAALVRFLPWLERHLVLVDSPHDGLPIWSYEKGPRDEVDRLFLKGGSVRPEPMEVQYSVDSPSFHGLGAEPLRGPIENTFLVGKTVLSALGQEGEILAACSAAKLITRTDPRREKMRLEMWNKVEIG